MSLCVDQGKKIKVKVKAYKHLYIVPQLQPRCTSQTERTYSL